MGGTELNVHVSEQSMRCVAVTAASREPRRNPRGHDSVMLSPDSTAACPEEASSSASGSTPDTLLLPEVIACHVPQEVR